MQFEISREHGLEASQAGSSDKIGMGGLLRSKFWRMQLSEISWLPERFFLVLFWSESWRFGPLAPFSSLPS